MTDLMSLAAGADTHVRAELLTLAEFNQRAQQLRDLLAEAREDEHRAYVRLQHGQREMLRCVVGGDQAAFDGHQAPYAAAEAEWRARVLYSAELRAEMRDLTRERHGEESGFSGAGTVPQATGAGNALGLSMVDGSSPYSKMHRPAGAPAEGATTTLAIVARSPLHPPPHAAGATAQGSPARALLQAKRSHPGAAISPTGSRPPAASGGFHQAGTADASLTPGELTSAHTGAAVMVPVSQSALAPRASVTGRSTAGMAASGGGGQLVPAEAGDLVAVADPTGTMGSAGVSGGAYGTALMSEPVGLAVVANAAPPVLPLHGSKPIALRPADITGERLAARPLQQRGAFPPLDPAMEANPHVPLADRDLQTAFEDLDADGTGLVPLPRVVAFFEAKDPLGVPLQSAAKFVVGGLARLNARLRREAMLRRDVHEDDATTVTRDEFAFLMMRWAQQ